MKASGAEIFDPFWLDSQRKRYNEK